MELSLTMLMAAMAVVVSAVPVEVVRPKLCQFLCDHSLLIFNPRGNEM